MDETHTSAASPKSKGEPYVLHLYVAGGSSYSRKAVVNLRKLCEKHLPGSYTLAVFDLAKNPALAADEQIVAAPTLVKRQPYPVRRFIGDMSCTDRLLEGLGVPAAERRGDTDMKR